MRLKLKTGKQEELIKKAKGSKTWKELARELNVSESYLRNELRYEVRYLNEQLYEKLCDIAKVNYDKYIVKKLPTNWGQVKGGKNSRGNTKEIRIPNKTEGLAEFVGIVLGDGHIFSYRNYKNGKVISVHQVKIFGNKNDDEDYLLNFVSPLCERLFNLKPKVKVLEEQNAIVIILSSVRLVEFLSSIGLKAGNKITNQLTIPKWIWKNKKFLKACIRGLFDTDGSLYVLTPHWPELLQLCFKNKNKKLLKDVRAALRRLGFRVSRISGDRIYITQQSEIDKFLKEINFNNLKHKLRYKKVRQPRGVVVKRKD